MTGSTEETLAQIVTQARTSQKSLMSLLDVFGSLTGAVSEVLTAIFAGL